MMKKICASIFLVLLAVLFVGIGVRFPWKERLEFYREKGGGLSGAAATVMDTARSFVDILNEHVPGHDLFVQYYGGVQRVLGVDAVQDAWNSVYRMKNGAVTFILDEPEPFTQEQINSIRSFADECDPVFVVIPQKSCADEYLFSSRGVNDGSAQIDAYRKKVFSQCGFSVLDLHEIMHDQGYDHLSMYFLTDHHWTIETGLWAAKEIASFLGLNTDVYARSQYRTETNEKLFLGSEGKRVGSLYAGRDDLNIPVPLFQTDYTLEIPGLQLIRNGTFSETMLFRDMLSRDYFNAMPYRVMLKGDHDSLTIYNRLMPQGSRVLMIKDSFCDCVAPYLAASCSQLTLLDMRYYEQSVLQAVRNGDWDMVLVTQSARTPNESFLFE